MLLLLLCREERALLVQRRDDGTIQNFAGYIGVGIVLFVGGAVALLRADPKLAAVRAASGDVLAVIQALTEGRSLAERAREYQSLCYAGAAAVLVGGGLILIGGACFIAWAKECRE